MLAHVLVGEPDSTSPEHALAKLRNYDFGAFPMEEMALAETQRLKPPADTRHVVTVGVAEASLEICLLARHDAVADHDCQRKIEGQDPRALCRDAEAAEHKKKAEIDGIAGPTVNAGGHEHAGRLV